MATKNLEVEPLDMRSCVKTICYNKYSKQDFLAKEKEIRKAVNYENEAPTCLDFILLYMRLIKMKLQHQAQTSHNLMFQISEFIQEACTIASDYFKSITIDASLLKYRPSILAAVCVNIGF